MTKKILITGNLGYIGPVLSRFLKQSLENIEITGFDTGYFAHCLTDLDVHPERYTDHQIYGDIRKFPEKLLDNVDCVIHLSAISNDPMGNQFEKQTYDINYFASVQLAKLCSYKGIKNFVFASSCSIYGFSEKGPRKETDELNPLTAYAKSKVDTEKKLLEISNQEKNLTKFTSLRFSTACGMSSRLRLDLVLNDFVACALTTKKITVLSDGTPWRPLIDVEDMSLAIQWAFTDRNDNNLKFLAVNVGSDDRNYQVGDLARNVSQHINETSVYINDKALPDKRSYQVDFSLFKKLAPNHQPRINLNTSINRLQEGLIKFKFENSDFRNSKYMRLKVIEDHIKSKRLNNSLYWEFQ